MVVGPNATSKSIVVTAMVVGPNATSKSIVVTAMVVGPNATSKSIVVTAMVVGPNATSKHFIMHPTSKKLEGSWRGILLLGRLCVRPCVLQLRFLMHNITFEPCMLGFWNFIYGFLMKKYLKRIFFLHQDYATFLSYGPLKNMDEILSAKYVKNYWS